MGFDLGSVRLGPQPGVHVDRSTPIRSLARRFSHETAQTYLRTPNRLVRHCSSCFPRPTPGHRRGNLQQLPSSSTLSSSQPRHQIKPKPPEPTLSFAPPVAKGVFYNPRHPTTPTPINRTRKSTSHSPHRKPRIATAPTANTSRTATPNRLPHSLAGWEHAPSLNIRGRLINQPAGSKSSPIVRNVHAFCRPLTSSIS